MDQGQEQSSAHLVRQRHSDQRFMGTRRSGIRAMSKAARFSQGVGATDQSLGVTGTLCRLPRSTSLRGMIGIARSAGRVGSTTSVARGSDGSVAEERRSPLRSGCLRGLERHASSDRGGRLRRRHGRRSASIARDA